MRTLIAALLAVVLLTAPACKAVNNVIDATAPLQIMRDGVLYTGCTAWQVVINGFRKYVSAYHCVADELGRPNFQEQWYIGGVKATLNAGNIFTDLVMFDGGPERKPLNIAEKPLEVGAKVVIGGYPHNSKELVLRGGEVVGQEVMFDNGQVVVVAKMEIGFGMSGSAVVNEKGDAVGVLHVGFGCNVTREQPAEGYCSHAGFTPLKDLRTFLGLN